MRLPTSVKSCHDKNVAVLGLGQAGLGWLLGQIKPFWLLMNQKDGG